MTITIEDPSEYELRDMLWSGAEDSLTEIIKAGYYDNLVNYIEDVYYDGLTLTQLNDILRFDFDQLKKDIGMTDWDSLKNLLNDKAIKKAEGVIQEIEDKWYSFSVSDENKDDKGNMIYTEMEDWVNDTYSNEPYSLVMSAVDLIADEIDSIIDSEEKTDDIDSMIEAITMCGLEDEFKDFGDIVDMTNEIESWIYDNL